MTDVAAEQARKHQQLVELLDQHTLDAIVLSRRCNVAWYTSGRVRNYVGLVDDVGNSHVVVHRDGATVLTTNIEAERLRDEDLPGTGYDLVAYPYHDTDARRERLGGVLGDRRVAADAALPNVGTLPLPPEVDRLRWTLGEEEVERYRAVATDVTAAVEATARQAEPGWTENAAAGHLTAALRAKGLVPWVLLVGADDRIDRFRHPLPTDTAAERRLMLVTCSERGGLIAACTRIVHFGPVPEALAATMEACATVDAALITSTRPGRTLGELFAVARRAYAAVGREDEWRLHHQGGSCGYLPREVKAAPESDVQVLENQAFAWNPTITGTKCEDTVLCGPEGTAPLAEPSDWPTVRAAWEGEALARPIILER